MHADVLKWKCSSTTAEGSGAQQELPAATDAAAHHRETLHQKESQNPLQALCVRLVRAFYKDCKVFVNKSSLMAKILHS